MSHLCVNTVELPRPGDIVQELSHVEAVIVGAVHLRMTAGSQCRHLVSVHCIGTEKVLHLLSNLYEIIKITFFVIYIHFLCNTQHVCLFFKEIQHG